jgi:Family of unknown function (DUF6459)
MTTRKRLIEGREVVGHEHDALDTGVAKQRVADLLLGLTIDRALAYAVHDDPRAALRQNLRQFGEAAFALPGGLPAVPLLPESLRVRSVAPDLRLVPALTASTTELDRAAGTSGVARGHRWPTRDIADEDAAPQQTPRAHLPEPTPWGGRLVQGILEVLSGVRPISQLVRWTTADVYDSILTRAQHRSQIMSELRQIGPQRFAEVVRSVHVSEPADGIAEVCAIVQQGPRCRAIALRLEGIDGRWQCTALQIG